MILWEFNQIFDQAVFKNSLSGKNLSNIKNKQLTAEYVNEYVRHVNLHGNNANNMVIIITLTNP